MSNTNQELPFAFPDPEGYRRYEQLSPEVVQELLAQGSPTDAQFDHGQRPPGVVVDLTTGLPKN